MSTLFTRLLLATEHTEFDAGAEALAIALAQRCQLPLRTVLPLVSNPEYEALAPQIAARAERDAAAKIAKIRAQAEVVGVEIQLRVRRAEDFSRAIIDEALTQASEMIIIRRRGKRGFLANLLVGEMVSAVVARAPCHVLVVPGKSRMWHQRVLVAAKPGAQGLRLIGTAAAIATECGIPLHVVSVVGDEAQRQSANTFVAAAVQPLHGLSISTEVRSGKTCSEILQSAAACQADLIVIGCRGDKPTGHATVGDVAQKLIGLSDHPVLVLHTLM